jgi:hypothetical protein
MAFLDFFKKKEKSFDDEQEFEGNQTNDLIEEHDHSSVRENDPYAYQASHIRIAWMFRISVALNIILGLGIAASYEAITALVEAYKPKVALLRVDPKENKLYRVEPINEDVEGFEILLEQKAKRYVRLMLEVDSVTQDTRFREAFRMTDRHFYNRFRKERIETNEIGKMISDGITRSITVETVSRIDRNGKVHKFAVDFIQTDHFRKSPPKIKQARAFLTMTTRRQEVHAIDEIENPLGITVLDMVLKEKANS